MDERRRTRIGQGPINVTLKCEICKEGIKNEDELRHHRERKHILCDGDCSKWFENRQCLINHKSQGKCVSLKCHECGKEFERVCELTDHMRNHMALPCPSAGCEMFFRHRVSLYSHVRKYHKEETKRKGSKKTKDDGGQTSTVKCENCKKICKSTKTLELHKAHDCSYCDVCHRYFKNKSGLHQHTCVTLQCEVCVYKCATPRQMLGHIRQVHTGERPFTCFCGKTFAQRSILDQHVKTVHKTNVRNEKGNQETCDKRHNARTDCAAVLCNECGHTSENLVDFMEHKQTHKVTIPTPENDKEDSEAEMTKNDDDLSSRQCKNCKKICRSSIHLQQHVNHDCSKCELCPRYFKNKAALKKHNAKVDCAALICDVCGHVSEQRRYFVEHMRKHTGEKPMQCSYCKRKFRHNSGLQAHIKRIHLKDKQNKTQVISSSAKKIQCQNCHAVFERLIELKNHHNGKCSSRKCAECSKVFRTVRLARIHKTAHTGDRYFQCIKCGAGFRRMTALYLHKETCSKNRCDNKMIIIPKLRKYNLYELNTYKKCKCGRVFKRRHAYIKHLTICSKKCAYCGHGFFQKWSRLLRHQQCCSKKNDYKCLYCQNIFTTKKLYKIHVRSFCAKRKFLYKCYCCESLESFDPENVYQVLDHVIKCKPRKDTFMDYKCYICSYKFSAETISLHIQDELIHSRLFMSEERKFECSMCTIQYPSQDLLNTHNKVEHPCHQTFIQNWGNESELVKDIIMPVEMKGLLQKEVERNNNLDLSQFLVDGHLPICRCYLCHFPFHCPMIKKTHVKMCEKKYQIVKAAGPTSEYNKIILPFLSRPIRRSKLRKRKLGTCLAEKLLRRVTFDLNSSENQKMVGSSFYWKLVGLEFRILPELLKKWLIT